jgi:predicted DNA-binding ribbon-helix-helix protein
MCRIFMTQDPASYAPETRSMRLHGHVTSIRLEAAFWEVLEELSAAEGTTVARFIATLHDEVLDSSGELSNLASLLRVTCLVYLRDREAHDADFVPIGALPA